MKLSEIYSPAKALGGDNTTLSTILNPLIQNVITISAIAALIVLIFAGFGYITSGGDEKRFSVWQYDKLCLNWPRCHRRCLVNY